MRYFPDLRCTWIYKKCVAIFIVIVIIVMLHVLQCRDYTLKKAGRIYIRGVHLCCFKRMFYLIINKLNEVQPPQKGYTFSVVAICYIIY